MSINFKSGRGGGQKVKKLMRVIGSDHIVILCGIVHYTKKTNITHMMIMMKTNRAGYLKVMSGEYALSF